MRFAFMPMAEVAVAGAFALYVVLTAVNYGIKKWKERKFTIG